LELSKAQGIHAAVDRLTKTKENQIKIAGTEFTGYFLF
jgi:hypothetical protein